MKKRSELETRMKSYEAINKTFLIPNMYNIIRLDGKAFHTYTKQFAKPFDDLFINTMDETAKYICETMQGAKFAYVQSDEISIYFTDTDTFEQQLWFKGNIQKIVSVAASKASAKFNHLMFLHKLNDISFTTDAMCPGYNLVDFEDKIKNQLLAEFDARVFQLPNMDELLNCFIWRQQDCVRNSISSVAQHNFSNKELHKKSTNDMKNMLVDKGDDWNTYPTNQKQGRFISKEMYINDIIVGTGENVTEIIYLKDSDGLFPSKHGRALQWSENTDSSHPDWCDIEIKKIRTNWDIKPSSLFVADRVNLKKKYFNCEK